MKLKSLLINNAKKITIAFSTLFLWPVFSSYSPETMRAQIDNYGQVQVEKTIVKTMEVDGVWQDNPDGVNPAGGEDNPDSGAIEEVPATGSQSDVYLTDAVLNHALSVYGRLNTPYVYDPNATYDDYEFDPGDWRLILINKSHSIPEGYKVPLGNIYGSWLCDERVIPDLLSMLKAARDDGASIYVASPYRTPELQVVLYNNKITKFMNTGMTYLEAYKLAGQAVTIPGTSEHEAGLCFDILSNDYKSLSEGFGLTKSGKWLAENAHYYGFILRYPADKEYITTIEYEPWHFRYVGVEAATVMYNEGLTLEEFWEKYLE